jgi:hypothetical protein
MQVRGPERFYSVCFKDDYGFYRVDDLFEYQDWPTARRLEFVMGDRPVSFTVMNGFGIYIKHEDFWVFGRTPEEVTAVADEWPEGDAA